jgi:sugar lactone lactonase YvrE
MALDNQGNVVVADSTNNCLQVFNPNDGIYLRTIGKKGSENGQFNKPQGVAFDNTTNNIIVADTGNNRVQVLRSSDDSHIRTIDPIGYGLIKVNEPCSVAVDNNGNLYVYDIQKSIGRIQVFRVSSGNYVRTIIGNGIGAGQLNGSGSIALDGQGNVAVAGGNRVQVFNPDGTLLRTIGSYGQENGNFDQPQGIAFDKAGNIIVADTNNNRVQVLNYNNGNYVRTIGHQGPKDGEFIWPYGVLIDGQGRIIVSDSNRIQVFGKNQEIDTSVSTSSQLAEIAKINSFEKETTNTKASKIILSIGINDFTPLDMLLQYLDTYDITKINKACGADTFSKYDDKTQLLNIRRYNPLTTPQTPQTEVYFDLFSDMIESNIQILIDIFKLGNPTIHAMIRNLRNSYTNLNKIGDDINVIHRATAILRAQLNSVVLRLQEGDIVPTNFGIDKSNPTFYEPKQSSNNVFKKGVIIYNDGSKEQRIPFKIIQICSAPNLYMVCISSNNRLPNELIEPVFTRGLNVNSYSVQIHGNTNIPKNNIKFIISQTDFENFTKTSEMKISIDLSRNTLDLPVTFNTKDFNSELLLAWMVNEDVPEKLDLLKCSKKDFFYLYFEKKDFFSSVEVFNNRKKEVDIINKESYQCFMMYTKLFTSNKPVFTLLKNFNELVNLLYNCIDFIRIFKQPPYNQSELVEEVTDLFNKLKLSNIEIKDFPHPFIDTFVDNLQPMILSIVKLFKIVFGVTYDKIRKIDLKNFKYLSLQYDHNYFSYSSFVTISALHLVLLTQSYVRIFMLLKEINDNFQKITQNNPQSVIQIDTLTDEQLGEIKKNINLKITHLYDSENKRTDAIMAEYELRKRLPIVTYCGSIMKFLSDSTDNTCGAFKNNVSDLILNISDITKNNTHVLQIFETLINSFVDIDSGEKCFNEIRQIYELLIIICDIFVLNDPSQKKKIDGYKTMANAKLPSDSQVKLMTKNIQHGGDRGIHILQEQVDKLDEIFKGCKPMTDKNDLSLIGHFTNFKNNLDCAIVSREDTDNFQELPNFIKINTITCLNNKEVKKSVNQILSTIQENLGYLERQRANISIIDVLVNELDNISKKSNDDTLYNYFKDLKESMKNDGPTTNIDKLTTMYEYIKQTDPNSANDYFKQCDIILQCLLYLLSLPSTKTLYASSHSRMAAPSSLVVPSRSARTAVAYGGKKQQKSATKKKQNNNRHNIKKKRSSIKKNKKCIVTRNTRRRIFE